MLLKDLEMIKILFWKLLSNMDLHYNVLLKDLEMIKILFWKLLSKKEEH
jgi:hypothetical protein